MTPLTLTPTSVYEIYNTAISMDSFPVMMKQRKRKRTSSCEADDLPAAKRSRLMTWTSMRFEQKCWEWRERRRKIALGIILYWEAQMRDIRRMARKRASSEMYADYVGIVKCKYMKIRQDTLLPPKLTSSPSVSSSVLVLEEATTKDVLNEVSASAPKRRLIKRLLDNSDAKETFEVKVTSAARRNGWRKHGEKRS